ncbi:unnamed protein product [Symbiodinium natans]|uniref:Uncharacterized protein n=1 Tax=Symbiodinium natans TaxID=878477 RepID=A0A812GHP6_9DINO|nr:unnamed protein product [Symbiodinium natans]
MLGIHSTLAQAFQQAQQAQPMQMLNVYSPGVSAVDLFAQDPGQVGPLGPRAVGPVTLDPLSISARTSIEDTDFGFLKENPDFGLRKAAWVLKLQCEQCDLEENPA